MSDKVTKKQFDEAMESLAKVLTLDFEDGKFSYDYDVIINLEKIKQDAEEAKHTANRALNQVNKETVGEGSFGGIITYGYEQPTILGKVNAILAHLGMEAEVHNPSTKLVKPKENK